MTTLTVLKFETADGADKALDIVKDLNKQRLLNLHDAAIVTWPVGKKKPKTKQLHDLAGAGALSGAFWGMLFGLIFFVPIIGLAVGATIGALTGSMTDVGIDDEFIKSIRSKVTEGTSALFLMTSDAVEDRVFDAMKPLKFELIASNLSKDEEEKLREAFAEEEAAPAY
ncbi:DUF1269 domain-containing protein [Methanosarcina sp. UBA289]|uniref:DUF1269 domain-containing protein n=1 Tax=Methanosarcina sp. UBA289 TaxID=1915574 RepID=UPI0025E8B8CE|nr:DUF1269 domain-containing protein [Methanosarcina sp. UBA289]